MNFLNNNIKNPVFVTTTPVTEGWYRVATVPITSKFKNALFTVKAYTATGTVTQSTITVDIASYSANYGSQLSAIFANTSHSYNASTNAENGYVLLYCRVSFDATNGYIDLYKYKTTAVTIEILPLTESGWVWSKGALTVNPTVGAYKNTTVTLDAGQRGNTLYANAGAAVSTYSNYGVLGGQTLSNTTDKTSQWSYVGYWHIVFNSTYNKGHSGNIRVRLQELSYDGSTNDLEDFVVIFKVGLPLHADGNAFNTAIPIIGAEIEGKTSLTTSDVAVLIATTSTSSKIIRLYIKLKSANKVYMINPEQRYGRSTASSNNSLSTSYCCFTYASDQPVVATLPTPVQGSIVYATKRTIEADSAYKLQERDTRTTNITPWDYMYTIGKGTITELKVCETVEITSIFPDTTGFVQVTTYIPWSNSSGGLPFQVATHTKGLFQRTGIDEATWGTWQKQATTSQIPTSLPANGGNASTLDDIDSTGFMKSGYLASNVDFNTVITSGCYRVNENLTNNPSGSGNYGILSVFRGSSGDTIMQMYMTHNTGMVYTRTASGIGGTPVWTAWKVIGDGGNADKLNGISSSGFITTANGGTVAGKLFASAHNANDVSVNGSSPAFEIKGDTTDNGGAFMSFHRPNIYACNFGLDKNNNLAVGGWSMGANSYKIWHAGNDGAGSGLDADTIDNLQGNQLMRYYDLNSINIDSTSGNFVVDLSELGHGTMPSWGVWTQVTQTYGGHFLVQRATNANTGLTRMAIRDKHTSTQWSPWREITPKYGTSIPTTLATGEVYYVHE